MAKENADIGSSVEDEDEGSDDADLLLELNTFRAQWMSELKPRSRASDGLLRGTGLKRMQELAREEKARELFLRAVEEEQDGAVYEAIKYYRRAMQLVPDIEFKINYSHPPDTDQDGRTYMEENDVHSESEDLVSYFEHQLNLESSFPKICTPELEMTQVHISALPREVLMYIFRWVVSSDLDMRALEQLSLVCRGFYICARDPEIWRVACLKVWGRSCTKLVPFRSWRAMFLQRPHVRFDGNCSYNQLEILAAPTYVFVRPILIDNIFQSMSACIILQFYELHHKCRCKTVLFKHSVATVYRLIHTLLLKLYSKMDFFPYFQMTLILNIILRINKIKPGFHK
ncbi:hypothetical protein LDENG_00045160 [Lucifuga dentata]|nr:hypothetical protein LDENG_00045160 [Lucifuga dentata]